MKCSVCEFELVTAYAILDTLPDGADIKKLTICFKQNPSGEFKLIQEPTNKALIKIKICPKCKGRAWPLKKYSFLVTAEAETSRTVEANSEKEAIEMVERTYEEEVDPFEFDIVPGSVKVNHA